MKDDYLINPCSFVASIAADSNTKIHINTHWDHRAGQRPNWLLILYLFNLVQGRIQRGLMGSVEPWGDGGAFFFFNLRYGTDVQLEFV